MKKLIVKLGVEDPMGNKKIFKVYECESGSISYSLESSNGTLFSTSNLQCGLKGPVLPDNVYECRSPRDLMSKVVDAVNGGTSIVYNKLLFLPKFQYKEL